ncbi:phage tail tape measure protein [Kerstersia gyiorum]|uniref:phage tail tape measure protein n=1 Tax=Kerstersia gyiorum TaxID=206506 RepID=UPI00214FB9C9|nr:phage tail tape measure protein [Kerstersia gyiorum]MCR4158837.1 phage tail tape measure protein [Kerstersia gyiorum]
MTDQAIGTARIDITGDASGVEAAVSRAKSKIAEMSSGAQAQYSKMTAAQKRQVDSLIRQADTLGMTRAQQIAYNASLKTSGPVLDEITRKLGANASAAAAAGKQFNKYGLTAAMEMAALRGVPAQITDIMVSLQGGQRPLTVLLQQGGQLKDMFGGVVPAAKALSGQLVKMINPATVLAGAGVAIGAAWYKGAMEMSEMDRHLVMTGNAMSITAGQVSFLADKFNEIEGVTRGAAVSALTEITKTGKITSSQLGMIGEVAVRANQILGKEISATVDEFNRLAEEPATASAELTKQYNYLNAETYLRIKALEDQGRKEEAAALAQDTFAKATNERLSEVKGNLTLLERGWDAVSGAAKGAWDSMLDIGRPVTILEKIKEQQSILARMQNPVRAIDAAILRDQYGSEEDIQKKISGLQDQLRRESGRQVLAANREYETQLAAQREAYIDDNASKAELRKKAVDEETRKWKKLSAGLEEGSKEYERLYAAHQNSLKSIEDKYKPKGGTRKAYSNDYATRMLLDLNQKEAAFRAQATGIDKLTSAQREMARFEQEIADIKEKKILTADEKSLVLKEEEIRLQLKANVAAEKEAQARESVLKFQERSRQIAEQMSAARESQNDQYQRSLDAYGLGDKAMERVQAQRSIFKEFASYQRQLSRGADLGLIGSKEYQEESSKIQAELQRRLLMDRSYYEEVDRLQSSWSLGAHQGLANYADYAANVFSGMEGLVGNAFGGMADALSTFVRTGKTSFSDLANSIIEDMIRITIQQSITGPLAMAFGGWLGGLGGGVSGAVSGASLPGIGGTGGGLVDGIQFSLGGYTGDGGKYDPAGIVHKGEGVLNQEEIRAIGGEEGFNALRRAIRGPGHAVGGMAGRPFLPSVPSSAGAGTVNVTINVSRDGTSQVSAPSGWEQLSKEIGEFVDAKIRERELKSQRQGGMAWKARQGAFS